LAARPTRVGMTVALGVALLFRVGQIIISVDGPAWAYDFSAYWHAGRQILEGGTIYSAEQLAGPYSPQQPFLYLYPPFLGVAMTPLAALFNDYRQAMWLWVAVGCAVFIASVWRLSAAERFTGPSERVFLVGAMFALAPVGFELVMGNVHILLLGVLAAAWLGIRRGTRAGDLAAGVLIGIAVLIKVFPALLIVWLVLTSRVRAALAAVASASLVALATVPIVGLDAWLEYPRVLANLGPPAELWSSLSPTSALTEWIDFGLARAVVAVAALAALIWSARAHSAATSFGVAVMLSILVVPTLYPHYLALAVLPLILAVAQVRSAVPVALAYGAVFVGGQLALLDLSQPVNRVLATVGALSPLVLLFVAGQVRQAGESTRAFDGTVAADGRPPGAT